MNAGGLVTELIDLIESELSELSAHLPDIEAKTARRIILGALDRFCLAHPDTPARPHVEPPGTGAMNEAEAKLFELRLLPERFKKHAGWMVGNVPVSYLTYLSDKDPFVRELGWYFRSRRGKERIERDDQ